MAASYSRRRGSFPSIRGNRGSAVLEGCLILPFFLLGMVFLLSLLNAFAYGSFLRHRLDAFASYAASVGQVSLQAGDIEIVDVTELASGALARSYLLEGGVLEEERLRVDTVLEEGILYLEAEYRVPMPGIGSYPLLVVMERRLWS
mgnify:CR=1 FL=1